MDRKPVNAIKSIYGIDSMNVWIEQQIKGGSKFRVYDVKKANALLQTQGYLASVGVESDGYWDSISPYDPSVNTQFSDRNPTETSNRSLLVNALETTTQNDWERKKAPGVQG